MFDVQAILQSGGILILALIIFAESGLLVGFFLPGDTLLVAAGLLASEDRLPLLFILPAAFLAATIGYQVGYVIGVRAGPRIFKRKDGILFREDYIKRTEDFFNRHGGKAVVLARFIPVIRTVVPLMAGFGRMPRARFITYNIIGGFVWTVGLILAAYWIGNKIPNLDKVIAPLILLAVALTTGSVFWQLLKSSKRRKELKKALRQELNYFFDKKSS